MNRVELLNHLDLSTFIAFDFETTGLSKYSDRIIEVAAVLYKDGKPVECFETLINPQIQISDEITRITGITNTMVEDSPTEKEIAEDFFKFLGDHPLVAHNAKFDEGFLYELYNRQSMPEKRYIVYDTLHLARSVLFNLPAYNLGFIAEYFKLSSVGSHRAKKDAENCGNIFLYLVEESASYPLAVISKCVSILKNRTYYNQSLFINLANLLLKRDPQSKGIMTSILDFKDQTNWYSKSGNDSNNFPDVNDIFGEKGRLSKSISRFEKRDSQIKYIEFIDSVIYNNHSIGIVEAGTGLGKSLGYLYEAVKYVCNTDRKKPVVISCYTKSLQDQLFYKDLPDILEVLDGSLRAVKLKGRANYICLSRLNWLIGDSTGILNDEETAYLLPLIFWLHWTKTGDIDECNGFLNSRNYRIKKMIQSEAGYCTTNICSEYDGCFLGNIRNHLFQSDIIVINHALLLSDKSNPNMLPPYDVLFIDEAHNLTDAAYSQYRQNIDRALLKSNLLICQPNFSGNKIWKKMLKLLEKDIKELNNILYDLEKYIDLAINAVEAFFERLSDEYGHRFLESSPYIEKVIINDVAEEYRNLPSELKAVYSQIRLAEQTIKLLYKKLDNFDPNRENINELILTTKQKMDSLTDLLLSTKFLTSDQDSEWVYWQEGVFGRGKKSNSKPEISLHSSPVDPGFLLSEYLFKDIKSLVLTSATLQVEHSFEYFLNRTGISSLDNFDLKFSVCPSPFKYNEQVKYFQYSGRQSLSDNPKKIAEVILKCHSKLKQKILVLFTSYKSLNQVTHYLKIMKEGKDLPIFSQTQASSRYGLLKGMKNSKNGILMGTSSFWEGIDLSGDFLEILIITKLPFQVPTDPIIKAYSQLLEQNNRNPFLYYTVPECILKYRQGYGRLIRTTYDEGIFIVLDNRVVLKNYGKQFQDAIPVNMQMFSTLDSLILN
ncbi:MAG: hypothetical protein CMG69_00955 [Candidatus Marinimicrobia bacterium]|nr:hypothetical protein [Candidatus Neomarinimicrobiota bacterium]|tara:strand:- start:15913 stop:18738 length:2826 start_codon:yes stop_codon:yes gene_type:complete